MEWMRFFRRRQWDDERARELESYLAEETADNITRGMTPEQARLAAQRKLGNLTAIREEIYQMNSLGLFETLWQDIRYGSRVLRKTPGSTLVALLSLALGIGASTAIFSVIYGVLISPYPYVRPDEIWAPGIIDSKNPKQVRGFYRMREFAELKKVPAFSDVMATSPESRLLTGDHTPETFQSVLVTSNAFRFLGVAPVLGRGIEPSDRKPDGQPEPVIVLTYKAWKRLFDGSPNALGKTLVLNDQPFTVIGVMPPRFGWWTGDGGWLVMNEDPKENRSAAPIVRLNQGLSQKVGEEQLQATHQQLAAIHPEEFPRSGFSSRLKNYMEITVASGEMESSLYMLFGAVGFLLLIACANVANLQLARATSRGHEIAVRMSIGAARGRLIRQLLTESILLSTIGGVVGVLLALGLTKAIVILIPESYVPNEARITLNQYALIFSACVSVLTGIVFGLAPALKCSRPDLVDALKDAGRALSTSAGARTRNALVVAEIALSVILLMGASLTIRGFIQLQNQDTGFHTDRVLMMGLQHAPQRYATYEQRVAFSEKVLAAVKEIPGVQYAAIGNGGLPFGGPRSPYVIEGQPRDPSKNIQVGLVSPEYSRAMGVPMRAGRELTPQEVVHADPVALINEAAAKLWPAGTNPIGARIRIDFLEKPGGAALLPTPPRSSVTVVGVVADTRNAGLRNPPTPAAYVPYTLVAPPFRTLALRTETAPMSLLNAVREKVRGVDKDQPLNRPLTIEDILGFETVQPRFNMALFSFFGALGLALAAVGIYSMLSYTVARRTHEIGIRMALGAGRREVLSLLFGMGGKLVITGLAIGLAASFILQRALRSQVFQVPGTDALAIAGVILLLTAVALLACLIPARRAAKLNPLPALRHD